MAYVNQYRQMFPTQFDVPTLRHRGQAAVDAYNAGKAEYEKVPSLDSENARLAYEADQKRMAAQAAWDAQQAMAQKQGQATYAGISALQQELVQNEAEISKLKQELSSLTAEYGDQDAVDRALAANRASIGDIANSRAHQEDIKWRWQQKNNKQSDFVKALKKEAKDLAGQLEDAKIAMMMGGNAERPAWEAKIARLERELAENPYGAKYVGTTTSKSGKTKTFNDFENLVSDKRKANANNIYKKSGLTNKDKEELKAEWESLSPDVKAANQKAYNDIMSETSIDQIKSGAANSAQKDKDALEQFKKSYSYADLNYKDKQGKLPTEINGRKVSVTRNADNSYTVTCGKRKVVINGNQ